MNLLLTLDLAHLDAGPERSDERGSPKLYVAALLAALLQVRLAFAVEQRELDVEPGQHIAERDLLFGCEITGDFLLHTAFI